MIVDERGPAFGRSSILYLAIEQELTMTIATSPVIQAPRGMKLRCKGWQQEAALRCLMNNLDPEVAERPADLVVYGGIGRAARNWECFHAIVRELENLGTEETLLVQSGKPVAVFPTHDMAPRVIIANSNLVGQVGQLGALSRARPQGPDDVRADDGGVVDLYRHAGDSAGHVPDVCGSGGAALWRVAGTQAGGDRWYGRNGWSAAAVGDDERWRGAGDRGGPAPDRAAARDALLRHDLRRSGRSAGALRVGASRGAGAVGRLGGQLRGRAAGDCAPRSAGGCCDGPDQRARSAEWLCSAGNVAGCGGGLEEARSGGVCSPFDCERW